MNIYSVLNTELDSNMDIEVSLVSAIRDLASAKDLQTVMDVVRISAREMIGADGITFVLRDGDKCFYAEENAISPLWKGRRFPMSVCISGWVMLNKCEVVIPDIFADERIPADAYRPTFVKSLAMVPVRRVEPVAAIGAYWAFYHEATESEMEVLFVLADAASVAISNVELTTKLNRSMNDSLEREKHELEERKLHHKLEERFGRIYEFAGLGIVIETVDGTVLQCNPAFSKMIGYSEEEIREQPFFSFIHSDDRVENLEQRTRLLNGDIAGFEIENRFVHKNGKIIWVKKVYSLLPDENPPSVIALITDISERKVWELERDGAIEFLNLVNNCINIKDLIHSSTLFFQRISGCEAVGIRLKEGVDYPYYETKGFPEEFVLLENKLCSYDVDGKALCDKNGKPILECMCGNVLCGRFDPTLPFFTEKGTFWSNCTTKLLASTTDSQRQAKTRNRCNGSGYESVALIPLRSGSEVYGLLQLNDKRYNRFTLELIEQWERLAEYLAVALSKFKVESELRISEERTELALFGADLGAWDWNIESGKFWFDHRWVEMLGYQYDEVHSDINFWVALVHPDDMEEVDETIRKHLRGETDYFSLQHRMKHKDGHWVWVSDRGRVVARDENGKALRMCGTHLDITKQRQMEERIRQTEKMDAIGQLAGGVAHDFNNQLTGILGYADMLAEEIDNEQQQGYISSIIKAAIKSSDLTRQLLTFSRKAQCQSVEVNIHETIDEVCSILKHTIDKRIEVRTFLKAQKPVVIGDPSLLQNALLNLAINARDAMPEGGIITFESSIERLDQEYCKTIPYEISPGEYLKVSISDTGCGIPQDDIQRIFEPFFTTKDQGKGTGMGLASVYGTVKHHQGVINVYSEQGMGTIFKTYLPLFGKNLDKTIHNNLQGSTIKQNLNILVIEDEESIRNLLVLMLEDEGCTVVTATNGKEGVAIYKEQWETIDVVIFDMIMPKMDGKDTFREMKKINSNIRAVLASGYSINGAAGTLMSEGVGVFIQKPFTRAQLNEAIAKVTHV